MGMRWLHRGARRNPIFQIRFAVRISDLLQVFNAIQHGHGLQVLKMPPANIYKSVQLHTKIYPFLSYFEFFEKFFFS